MSTGNSSSNPPPVPPKEPAPSPIMLTQGMVLKLFSIIFASLLIGFSPGCIKGWWSNSTSIRLELDAKESQLAEEKLKTKSLQGKVEELEGKVRTLSGQKEEFERALRQEKTNSTTSELIQNEKLTAFRAELASKLAEIRKREEVLASDKSAVEEIRKKLDERSTALERVLIEWAKKK